MSKSALQRVRHALYTLGKATRPRLAADTGLSLVSCNRAVAELCRLGEAEAIAHIPSGGGRPALLYQLNRRHAYGIYFKAQRLGTIVHGELEVQDMQGAQICVHRADFAYLGENSLDAWLDRETKQRSLYGIALEIATELQPPGLVRHLSSRYQCPVRLLNSADALADGCDNTLTLHFIPGQAPLCSMHRNGIQYHTGALELLPMPCAWAELDYSDHTMVEEMVARLLTILSCTLQPVQFALYADFWTPRLVNRIHFNASAKLRQDTLALQFAHISPRQAATRLRDYAHRCFLGTTGTPQPERAINF